MVPTLLALALVAGPNLYAGNALYPDMEGFSGSGVMFTDLDLDGYKLYYNQGADHDTYTVWNSVDRVDIIAGAINALRVDNAYVRIGVTLEAKDRIFDPDAPLNLGAAATTSHSLVSGDVLVGNDFEVDGAAHFDAQAFFYSNINVGGVAATDTLLKVGSNTFEVRKGDDSGFQRFEAGLIEANGHIFLPNANDFYWATGTLLDIGATPTDGHMRILNNAGTQGMLIDLTADGVATLTDEVGGGLALRVSKFEIGSNQMYLDSSGSSARIVANAGVLFQQAIDISIAGSAVFKFSQFGSAELTGQSGTQYGTNVAIEIQQGTTAAFVANQISVTDTSSGSGQDYLARWDWGDDGIVEFAVKDDGTTTIASPTGAATTVDFPTTTLTFAGGGEASKTATGFRAVAKHIEGISGRVTVAGTTCATIDIGDNSGDGDRYGAAIAVSAGTTFDIADATADPKEFIPTATGAGDVVITANGGDCVDLVVVLTRHDRTYTAATSN